MCMVKSVAHPRGMPRHRFGVLFALLVTLAAPPAYCQEEVPADRILGVLTPGSRVGDSVPYPDLLRRVESGDARTRSYALELMRAFFPDSARAVALRRFRTFGETEAVAAAHAVLGDSGEGLPQLIVLLPSLPTDVLARITLPLAEGFRRAGVESDSLQRELMRSPRGSLRVLAMGLFMWDIDPSPVSSAEREILDRGARDEEPKVRVAALRAVAWRVPRSDTAGMSWAAREFDLALDDRDREVRHEAMHDIGWREFKVPGRVERLRVLARDGHTKGERSAAIRALGVQRNAAIPAIPDLLKYLRGRDRLVRSDALHAIRELAGAGVPMGPEARNAVRALRAREENPYYQLDAMRALAALGDTAALATLTTSTDTIVAAGAVGMLASVAPFHPAVAAALDDPRDDVRRSATLGLVPVLYRDPTAVHPRTPGGIAARDSALKEASAITASRLVGKCFAVEWGAYSPALDLGIDSIYQRPPNTIAFLIDQSDFPSTRRYLATIALANGATPTFGTGLWSWDTALDSLDAAWTTGFSGVAMTAGWDGAVLRGTLTTFWDFPRERQAAEVTLTPVECTSIKRDRGEE